MTQPLRITDMGTVLVVHPLLQHSHQLAWALSECGLLRQFWSGVPVGHVSESPPWWMPQRLSSRLRRTGIPSDQRRPLMPWYAGAKLASNVGSPASRYRNIHRVFHAFDRTVAADVRRAKPGCVVAYENSALHIFKAAKESGALCVLDAASIHYETGNRLISSPDPDFLKIIDTRKQREIELADFIICCSEMARQTYIKAGVPPNKVKSMLLGASLPHDLHTPMRSDDGVTRFVFAGSMQERKSIDIILDCFARLHLEQPGRCTLDIYGGSEREHWSQRARATPSVQVHGPIDQIALYRNFAKGDCLLLPSRFDSFGMVVAEAMATGLPAIVSDMTGAQEIITHCPGSGWIIKPTLDSLYQQITALLMHPETLHSARPHALDAARMFTWAAYRERTQKLFQELLIAR